ncbi:MAG: leucine-rich repeat domain-containing protein [Prevotella sp.]|nr:leucine-rich repeat domain-containing protein [Prevotella sp.]
MAGLSASAHDCEVDGIYYNLDETAKTATVTYYGTSIGSSQYTGSVVIPESITYRGNTYSVFTIGDYAFYCQWGTFSSLTSITIPNSVITIGESAFHGCNSLSDITIGNSVTTIGADAFGDCPSLTSITIPNSVSNIGDAAFSSCTGLTSITIPNSVTDIGNHAFNGCTGLTSITIPNSVTDIGNYAFQYCTDLGQIVVEHGNPVYDSRDNCNAIIETASNTLIASCKSTIIPNSVTTIKYVAFQGCKGLTSITIPNSVTSIGGGAFENCTDLIHIVVEQENPVYDSRDNCNAIIETASNTLIVSCKNTVIPNSITTIGALAFSGVHGLTSITIPNSVTTIGGGAFSSTDLTSITIPSSVTRIDGYVFSLCFSLTSITSFIQEPFEIKRNVFQSYTATLYVPKGTKEKYEATAAWNQFKKIVEMDDEFNAVDAVCFGAETTEANRYTLGGQRVNSQQKGLNIIRMSDGTTRKVLVK